MKNIRCKLGNMKKIQEWVIYPKENPDEVIIQCANRIARVRLKDKTAVLSSGKMGNHFVALQAVAGATIVTVPDEIIQELSNI